MAWTTDDLIDAVKRRAQLPEADGKLSDHDILDLASEELQTQVVPMITTAAEHYYIHEQPIPLVTGQNEYLIPAAVQAGTLYDIALLDQNGSSLGTLAEIPLSDLPWHSVGGEGYPSVMAFALRGDKIVIVPTPTSSVPLTMNVRFIRRPNLLVPVASCAQVVSWLLDTPTPGRTEFTTTPLPPTMATGKLDLVQAIPNFLVWTSFVSVANFTSNTFDVDSDAVPQAFYDAVQSGIMDGVPTQPAYWCPSQQTCVVTVPDLFHPVLVSAVCAQVLRSIGDFQGAAIEQEHLDGLKGRVVATIAPRTRSRGKPIIASSHPLRTGVGRRSWWF